MSRGRRDHLNGNPGGSRARNIFSHEFKYRAANGHPATAEQREELSSPHAYPSATKLITEWQRRSHSRHIRDVRGMSAKPQQRSNDASLRMVETGHFLP